MHFCLAEFEGAVRIMGMLKPGKKQPIVGQKVKLDRCSLNDGNYNFDGINLSLSDANTNLSPSYT